MAKKKEDPKKDEKPEVEKEDPKEAKKKESKPAKSDFASADALLEFIYETGRDRKVVGEIAKFLNKPFPREAKE
jgi:hypothetical protein